MGTVIASSHPAPRLRLPLRPAGVRNPQGKLMSGANYEWCPVCDTKVLYVGEEDVPAGVMVLHKACQDRAIAEAVAAERERLYAELGNDHFVIFTEDRWTIEHSVECRLSGHIHECEYHTAARRAADECNPWPGRWRINGIDGDGLPSLERAGQPGEEKADA